MENGLNELNEPLDDWLAISLEGVANGSGEAKSDLDRRALLKRFRRAQRCLQLLESAGPDVSANGSIAVEGMGEELDGRTLGRFQIRRELGRGAHGIVYMAVDPILKRRVALKVPRPETLISPDLKQRFLREARTVAELNHLNLIPVLEVGEAGPACYIAQQYCSGPTLSHWLKERATPTPIELAAALVRTLAEAVQFVHLHGVVHRDIKPGNILLEPFPESIEPPSGLDGRLPFTPKLTDFGLARLTEEPQGTRTGAVMGTPAYMAPEQAAGQTDQIRPATDVYALGGILYELLTGQPPVGRAPELETIRRVADGEIVRPRCLRPDLPRDLEAICLKCLELQPSRRYSSAAALARELEQFLRGGPISARKIGLLGRYLRWSRRRPIVAALTAALAASIVIGVAGVVTQWRSAEAHRARAEANFQQAHEAVRAFHEMLFSDAAKSPAVLPLRRELMEVAVTYQRDFFARHSENPGLAADLADGLYQLGFAAQSLGDHGAALEHYSAAIPLWESLRKNNPTVFEHSYFLVKSLHQRGQLLHGRQQLQDAHREYLRGLALCEEVAQSHPNEPSFRKLRASHCRSLGNLKSDTGDLDGASEWFSRERMLREELCHDHPEDVENRRDLAKLFTSIGTLEAARKQPADAVLAFETARSMWQQLAESQGDSPYITCELAVLNHALGRSFIRTGQHDDARVCFDAAEETFRSLVDEFPAVYKYRSRRAQNQQWIAFVHHRDGRSFDALKHLHNACRILQDLTNRQTASDRTQWSLATVYEQIGEIYTEQFDAGLDTQDEAIANYVAAASLYEGLAQRDPPHPDAEDRLRSVRDCLKSIRGEQRTKPASGGR